VSSVVNKDIEAMGFKNKLIHTGALDSIIHCSHIDLSYVWPRSLELLTLTTLYLQFEKEAALGLPPGVHSYALLPIGYPMGRFGPVRPIALTDVVNEDRWGEPHRDL
jgi:hypothetical protein